MPLLLYYLHHLKEDHDILTCCISVELCSKGSKRVLPPGIQALYRLLPHWLKTGLATSFSQWDRSKCEENKAWYVAEHWDLWWFMVLQLRPTITLWRSWLEQRPCGQRGPAASPAGCSRISPGKPSRRVGQPHEKQLGIFALRHWNLEWIYGDSLDPVY